MNDKQLKVLGLLKSGLTPRQASEESGVIYPTVMNWKRKWDNEDEESLVAELAQHEVRELLHVKSELADTAPHIKAEVEELIDGVVGLKELEPKFHATMMTAIKKADTFLEVEDITIKEWQMIVKTISDAYAAIFNKSGTVVNVANTNISAGQEQVKFFQASKGN